MYMFSQWFILLHFLHGCISFRASFGVPHSCLLFSICVAYADASFDVSYMLVMSYCYGSTWLSNIILTACVTYYFVYSTWVPIVCFLCQLLIYCIVGFECFVNVRNFKQIGYLSYQWAYILFRIFRLGSYCLLFVPATDILYCWLWMLCECPYF
jgi:hypothetical protein